MKVISPDMKASASLNLMNFMFYGGISCVVPFLSVHMRSIGLTTWHLLWVHVASGLVCILVPLLVGSLSERKSSSPRKYMYKLYFAISLTVSVLGYTSLIAVPKVQRIPRQPMIDFDCSSPINAIINLEKCDNWDTCSSIAAAWPLNTLFRLSHCRYKSKQAEEAHIYPSTPNPLHLCFRSAANTTNLCLVYDPHITENPVIEFTSDLTLWQYTEYRNVSAKEFSFSDTNTGPPILNVCNFAPATSGTIIKVHNKSHDSLFCRRFPNEDVTGIKCLLSLHTNRKKPACYDVIGDMSFTFWMYLGLRAVADSFFLTALCLLEGITLRTVQVGPYNRGAYGKTRIWPSIAMIMLPIITGILVDYFTDVADMPDYSPAFFLSAAFGLTSSILIFVLTLRVGGNTFRYEVSSEPSDRNHSEDIGSKYKITVEMVVASFLAVFAGIAWSIEQVFDPLLYQDLGFSHLLLGAAVSFGYLCGLPFLSVSKTLVHNIGEVHLICAGFAFHSIHLAGLSFVSEWFHLWWATPFEAMKAFTIPIMWLAFVAYVEHTNSSKGRRIAMQYAILVMHFAIGRIMGCFIGSFGEEHYSLALAYRIVSAVCLLISVFLLIFYHRYLKPRHRKIATKRVAIYNQTTNGSCLLLVERVPVNGLVAPRSSNVQ